MTLAEKIIWDQVRGNKLGVKFRRQEAFCFGVYRYVADFCCHSHKLIIEIDGGIHEDEDVKECDQFREEIFANEGYRVLRLSNKEVLDSILSAIMKIKKVLNS